MKKRNLFWGIIFLLSAVFLIVGKMGWLAEFSFLSLFFTVILLGIFMDSLIHLSFAGIFFSAAFLVIIYEKQLGILNLTPGTILGAALLATIGCSLLFHKKKYKHFHYSNNFSTIVDEKDESVIRYHTEFGSTIKYVNSDDFRQVDLKCSFGAMKVYFDHAVIKEPGACINIELSFGAIELYVPSNWNLHYSIDTSLAGVEEKNKRTVPESVDVNLNGTASFSGITIHYI